MNKLTDLNDALHAQLQRLASADGESLKGEIERSRAVSGIAKNIVENARLALEGERFLCSERGATLPPMLENGGAEE